MSRLFAILLCLTACQGTKKTAGSVGQLSDCNLSFKWIVGLLIACIVLFLLAVYAISLLTEERQKKFYDGNNAKSAKRHMRRPG